MIHTALITLQINGETYNQIIKNEGIKYLKDSNSFVNTSLWSDGITFYKLSRIDEIGYKASYISMKINLSRLAENEFQYGLFEMDADSVDKITNKFDFIVTKKINPNLSGFKYWKVNRIDYSIDIKTPYVEEYIELFHKAAQPGTFQIPLNDQGKHQHKEGSLYYTSHSLNINFYNKYEQMNAQRNLQLERNEEALITEEELKNCKDVLRLEIQCKRHKVYDIKRKYNLKVNSILGYMDSEIGHDLLTTYYSKVVGDGDFYKLDKARKTIDKFKKVTETSKTYYKDLLTNITKSKSLRVYLKSLDNDEQKKAIRVIKNLGEKFKVNAVTISQKREVDSLKGLLEIIEQQYKAPDFNDFLNVDDINYVDDDGVIQESWSNS